MFDLSRALAARLHRRRLHLPALRKPSACANSSQPPPSSWAGSSRSSATRPSPHGPCQPTRSNSSTSPRARVPAAPSTLLARDPRRRGNPRVSVVPARHPERASHGSGASPDEPAPASGGRLTDRPSVANFYLAVDVDVLSWKSSAWISIYRVPHAGLLSEYLPFYLTSPQERVRAPRCLHSSQPEDTREKHLRR